MAILHGSWLPGSIFTSASANAEDSAEEAVTSSPGCFFLWGEVWRRVEPLPSTDASLAHPFTLSWRELRDRLAEQERQQTTESSKQSLLETFADRQYWTTLSSEERRDIYRALVNRIVIQDGEIVQIEIMV